MRAFVLVLALAAVVSPLDAQKDRKIPKRPRLTAGADTNSWGAYYFHGLNSLEKRPHEAADAFYWAAKLEPTAAEPLYGRWAAFWATDLLRLARYYAGQRFVVESKEVVANDSLLDRALQRDPFLHRSLEKELIEKLYREATGELRVDWNRADPYMRGWLAYNRGQMALAAQAFREALKKKSDALSARLYLARSLYYMREFDSSAVELGRVVEEMRKTDQKKVVYYYQSKAHLEYTIGIVHAHAGKLREAKEGFGRALTEDLAFSMAHTRLAEVALAAGDTAEALQEHDLAVQLRPDDAFLRYMYGAALIQAKKHGDAIPHLEKVVELEPHFAAAYFNLAVASEMTGRNPDAVTHYKSFLARAPRVMIEQIAMAQGRVKELEGLPAVTGGSE